MPDSTANTGQDLSCAETRTRGLHNPLAVPADHEVIILAGGQDAEREVSMMAASRISDSMSEMGLVHRIADLDQLLGLISDKKPIIVFNVLYGPFGEGGAIAGLMDCLDIPCVYSPAGASAIALDKWRCQLVLEGAGIATSRGVPFDSTAASSLKGRSYPVVLKPLKQGSSVDVSVAHDEPSMVSAIAELCRLHGGGIIEDYLAGAEYSVGVLGMPDGSLLALPPIGINLHGRLIASSSAKYGEGLSLECPAPGDPDFLRNLAEIAKRTYQVIGCSQVIRVDFRCDDQGNPRVLEVNHHPGMTDHSWLPIAANAAGIRYEDLIAILLSTAMQRQRVSGRFRGHAVLAKKPDGESTGSTYWVVDGEECKPPSSPAKLKTVRVNDLFSGSELIGAQTKLIDAMYDDYVDCTELRACIDALGYHRVGMSILSSALSTDKLTQRRVAGALGVPQPAYQEFSEAALLTVSQPAVLKKRFSNQSRDVHLVSNYAECLRLAGTESEAAPGWLVEEYAQGDEVHLIMGLQDGMQFVSKLARIAGRSEPWLLDSIAKSDPAAIPLVFDVTSEVETIVLALSDALFCAFDRPPICRIEWRVDVKNHVKFVEFDACPGLSPHGLAARILANSPLAAGKNGIGGEFLC